MVASRVIARTISVVLLVLALGPVLISEVGAQTADQANSSCQPAKERDGKKCNTTVQGAIIEGICGGGSCNAKSSTGTDGNKEAVNENTTEIQKGAIEKAAEVNAESESSGDSSSKYQGRLSDNPDAGMGNASTADDASNAPGSGTNAAGDRFESTRPAAGSDAPERGWDNLSDESVDARESILQARDEYAERSGIRSYDFSELLSWDSFIDPFVDSLSRGSILDFGYDAGFGYKSDFIFVSDAEIDAGGWGGSRDIGVGRYSGYGSPDFSHQFDSPGVTGFGSGRGGSWGASYAQPPFSSSLAGNGLQQISSIPGNTSAVFQPTGVGGGSELSTGSIPSGVPGVNVSVPMGLTPAQQATWANAYNQVFASCGGGVSCVAQAQAHADIVARQAGATTQGLAGYLEQGLKSATGQIMSAFEGIKSGINSAVFGESVQVADAGPLASGTINDAGPQPVRIVDGVVSRYTPGGGGDNGGLLGNKGEYLPDNPDIAARLGNTFKQNEVLGVQRLDENGNPVGPTKFVRIADSGYYPGRVLDLQAPTADNLGLSQDEGTAKMRISSYGVASSPAEAQAMVDSLKSQTSYSSISADYTPSSKFNSVASDTGQPPSLSGSAGPSIPATVLAEQTYTDYVAANRQPPVTGSDANTGYAGTGSFGYNPPLNTAANTDIPSSGGWTSSGNTSDFSGYGNVPSDTVPAPGYFDTAVESPLPVSFEVLPVSGDDIPTLTESGGFDNIRAVDVDFDALGADSFDGHKTVFARTDVTPDTLIAVNDFDDHATAALGESDIARAIDLPGPDMPASPFGLGDEIRAVGVDEVPSIDASAAVVATEPSFIETVFETIDGARENVRELFGFTGEEVLVSGISENEQRGALGTQSGTAVPRQGTLNQSNPSQEASGVPGAAGTQSGPASARSGSAETAQGPAAPGAQSPGTGGAGAPGGVGGGPGGSGAQSGAGVQSPGANQQGNQQGGGGIGDMLKGLTDMLKGGGGQGGGGGAQPPAAPVQANPNTVLATPVPSTQFPPAQPLTPAPTVSVVANPNPTQRDATSIVSWTAAWADAQPATSTRECAVIDATGKTHVDHASSTDSFETPKLSQGMYFVVGCKQPGGKLGSAIVLVRVVGDTQAPIAPPTAALASYESSSGQSQAGNELAAALGVPGANQPTQQLNVACDPNSPSYFDCLTGKMLFVDKLY